MLKYTGSANFEKLSIRIYGDGYSKDVTIDLSKAPFNLAWKGFYPKNAVVSNISPGMAKSVTLSGDNLMIIFSEPPPETIFPDATVPITGAPSTKLAFDVYFVYGTGVTRKK
jgi:hypothetical protein